MRENLVNTILELSGDELQYEDLVVIAKESEQQLVERLIHISNYYKVQANQ
jgi:hypothetical protein